MTTTFAAKASRQMIILTAIAGLHLAVFILIASGLFPKGLPLVPPESKVTFYPKEEDPIPRVAPDRPGPIENYAPPVPKPDDNLFPRDDEFPDQDFAKGDSLDQTKGSGAVIPATDYRPPSMRTRDNRLAAAIDACYPAASRRAGEEGRVVARIMIDASGKARAWSVAETSGFPRLDGALDCVTQRIAFVAGRRDGSAVAAEAMLPIVFRLK